MGLALLSAFLLARHLSRPVSQLDETVAALAGGDFEKRAEVSTEDEIGRLARNVNQLAVGLQSSRSARQRWMADIAHELRTPVAVLKGEIEAVADGVRKADERMADSLREEIEQLSLLIDDLQSLALADAGALNLYREEVDFSDLVKQQGEAFLHRLAERDISLKTRLEPGIHLSADPQRLRQLLHNLLENCRRYTETGGGFA
jgi:two-component system sensor histidine kinase BaeS